MPKLFFSAESAVHIAVGAGLARQINHFDYRVMQGRMSTLELDIEGEGEVVNVDGQNILNWNVKRQGENGRRLIVKLNISGAGITISWCTHRLRWARSCAIQAVATISGESGSVRRPPAVGQQRAVQLEPVSLSGLSQLLQPVPGSQHHRALRIIRN